MADVARGEKIFKQRCLQCHTVEKGAHKMGPSLHGIFGKKAGTAAGFPFSEANKNAGVTWTEETLSSYIENWKKHMPGSKMVFAGLKKEDERADLIAYLKKARAE
eukprot:tig00001374_g8502.t1